MQNRGVPHRYFGKGAIGELESLYPLYRGIVFNEFLLYDLAIESLTESIELNPYNVDAYKERSYAYFEIGEMDKAICDYQTAVTLFDPLLNHSGEIPLSEWGFYQPKYGYKEKYLPENKADFAKGLCLGVLDGGKDAVIDFIPMTLNTLRGITQGLWAFAASPQEISDTLIQKCYAFGAFIINHSAKEYLETVVPEIGELSEQWDILNDYHRGKEIGYIVGKCGVDIFGPVAGIKAFNMYRAFRRANAMMTVHSAAASSANKAKIATVSAERYAIRQRFVQNAMKEGKLIAKNANAKRHILQQKHAWDRVVNLSGNLEKRF